MRKGDAEFDLEAWQRFAHATYRLSLLARSLRARGRAQRVGRDRAAGVGAALPRRLSSATATWALCRRAPGARVTLIAIDPTGEEDRGAGELTLQLHRAQVRVGADQAGQRHLQVRVAQEGVAARGEAARRDRATGHALDAGHASTPGNYALRRSQCGRAWSSTASSTAWPAQGNVTRSLDRNAELQLTLDSKDYAPGDEIEISIRAPYVGAGLITIERDKVYAHAWFKADTTASVQKIRVPKDFEGNGYVNVQFVRDPSSDEIFMSPLSLRCGAVRHQPGAAHAEAAELDAPDLGQAGHRR